MNKLDDNVKSLLNSSKVWHISTTDDMPNVVPVLFKTIDENDNLVLFDVFMKKTVDNIKKNGKIAITIYDLETLKGYQLKGKARYTDESALVDVGDTVTKGFGLKTKGAVIVQVNEAVVTSPGHDNGKVL